MVFRNSAQFVIEENASSAKLKFKGKDYQGSYALIPYGNKQAATHTHERLLPFKRMANCHPPLPDHSLAFSTLSKSLSDLLIETDFLKRIETDKDQIKHLLKSVALLSLQAREKSITIDLSLDKITCHTMEKNQFILIKCIPLKQDGVVEFGDWKKELIHLYEEIKTNLGDKMFIEYDEFKELVENSNTKEDFLSIFQSWIFWDIEKRMSVICKLTGMIDKQGMHFLKFCDGGINILRWRRIMSKDTLLEEMVNNFTTNKLQSQPESRGYKMEEASLFLTFIRTPLAHFSTFQNTFKSEMILVSYLDRAFLDIMREVYRGCTEMEKQKRFAFGIDK